MHSKTFAAALLSALLVSSAATAQVATPALKSGDSWTYRQLNGFNKLMLGQVTREITAGSGGEIRVSNQTADGRAALASTYASPGLLTDGTLSDRAAGTLQPALELLPFPLREGQEWTQRVVRQDPITHENREVLVTGKVVGWETVRVPAGEFKALKITRRLWLGDWDMFRGQTWRGETEWYSPEVKGTVKLEVFEEYPERRYSARPLFPGDRFIYELISFRAS